MLTNNEEIIILDVVLLKGLTLTRHLSTLTGYSNRCV